jgi:hypothetical protein
LPDIEGDKEPKKRFKSYPIGFFPIDIAEIQTAEGKLYLFVAIDRTSRFAFVQRVKRARHGRGRLTVYGSPAPTSSIPSRSADHRSPPSGSKITNRL